MSRQYTIHKLGCHGSSYNVASQDFYTRRSSAYIDYTEMQFQFPILTIPHYFDQLIRFVT